ncbi:MAG: PHP domain-containing protein [Phycisphaerae bacterium]|nr:PHP domain-containing protein [Phycisphaerae bacterium]
MEFVDLHCHSTASDGTLAPDEVVRVAKQNGLVGLALTDHDTVAGVPGAATEAHRVGIAFIAGIEISCEYPRPGTMHLLGYGIDPDNPTLRDMTKTLIDGRNKRNEKMIARFNEIGIPLTMEKVLEQSGDGVIGRPHFAAALMKMGVVSTIAEAFKTYLGQGGRVYFDKERLSPKQAIEMIRQAGGLTVLAHPSQLQKENNAQLENAIKELIDYGLAGVEVIHSDHRESLIDFLSELADKYHLLKTGGSDFHGSNKPHISLGKAGSRRIPRQFMDELLARHTATKKAS